MYILKTLIHILFLVVMFKANRGLRIHRNQETLCMEVRLHQEMSDLIHVSDSQLPLLP